MKLTIIRAYWPFIVPAPPLLPWRAAAAGLLAVLLLTAAGCGSAVRPAAPVETGIPVESRSGAMVAAAHPLAVEAGQRILRAGGGAVDAAVAVALMLTLVEPASSGIGGGGFLLHFEAASGRLDAYDGRETAPAAVTPSLFVDVDGRPRSFYDAAIGGASVGVPGLLRMLELAHRRHGRLPWPVLFGPAIETAEAGFPVSPRLARLIAEDAYLRATAPAAHIFYHPDGTPAAAGERLVNPELAATLRAVAEGGADAFHTGDIARDIVRTVRTAARIPGGMTEADLAGYRPLRREPICRPYRRWRVCGVPPPTSGGIAVLQILGLVEPVAMADIAMPSPTTVHRFVEAARLAFADRDAYVADPDFAAVPTAGLLDADYLRRRAELIGERAMPPPEPGLPRGAEAAVLPTPAGMDGFSTSHLAIVDGDGNAVSMTASIENTFGSRLMVRGFLLNNQLTDFAFVPSVGGAPVANRPEPGKRPRSSMAPTLVFDESGRLVLAIGSPGGPRIISYVAQTLFGVLDGGLDLQAAIDQPRIVAGGAAVELERDRAPPALAAELGALGHPVVLRELESGLNGIQVTGRGLAGGADRRREGVARGE